ncbi:MAG: hypothetical protein ABI883_01800 [Chthoniobacterales bacterium]
MTLDITAPFCFTGPMSGSSTLAAHESRSIFRVGNEAYTIADVIAAAQFRGELEPAWQELLRLVACEERAQQEEREADEETIDRAVQAFRYEHDLITAEEAERWLAERGLGLEEFSEYFVRHYWGEADEVTRAEVIPVTSASAELRTLLVGELTLSGELGRMAQRFSWRLAARQASGGADDAGLNFMAALEEIFRIACEQVLTPQARQRELGSLRMQLTALDFEAIEFDSHDAACEALFCVRDDEMSMEEVAREGRYPFCREQVLLEDIAPEIQQQFVSAVPGELLEPSEIGGGYRLVRVLDKSEPNPDNLTVRQRIEHRLLERHFADLVGRYVHWDLLLS